MYRGCLFTRKVRSRTLTKCKQHIQQESDLIKSAGAFTYLLFSPVILRGRLLMKKVAKPQNGLGIRHCERRET